MLKQKYILQTIKKSLNIKVSFVSHFVSVTHRHRIQVDFSGGELG
jgi:hypothetical protein